MLVVVVVFELVTLAVLGVEAPLFVGTLASTSLRDLCLASPLPLVVGGPGGSAIYDLPKEKIQNYYIALL